MSSPLKDGSESQCKMMILIDFLDVYSSCLLKTPRNVSQELWTYCTFRLLLKSAGPIALVQYRLDFVYRGYRVSPPLDEKTNNAKYRLKSLKHKNN